MFTAHLFFFFPWRWNGVIYQTSFSRRRFGNAKSLWSGRERHRGTILIFTYAHGLMYEMNINIHSFTIWIKNEQLPVDHTFWWPILRKKFHEIFTIGWEAISKTRASCFIRGSNHLETIKTLGLRPRAFICFSVFGTPDETLALVFDILLQFCFCMVHTVNQGISFLRIYT